MPPRARRRTKRASPLTSSSSTDPRRPKVARLGRPHGLEGFLGLYVDEENLGYFAVGAAVYVDERPYVVRSIRSGDKGPQVAFEEVLDRNAAEALRGGDVFAASRRHLDEEEYWPEDLIGLEVTTVDGDALGRVIDVVLGVAQDRLVIGPQGIEVPLVGDLVPTIDLDEGRITVESLPGLTAPPH